MLCEQGFMPLSVVLYENAFNSLSSSFALSPADGNLADVLEYAPDLGRINDNGNERGPIPSIARYKSIT